MDCTRRRTYVRFVIYISILYYTDDWVCVAGDTEISINHHCFPILPDCTSLCRRDSKLAITTTRATGPSSNCARQRKSMFHSPCYSIMKGLIPSGVCVCEFSFVIFCVRRSHHTTQTAPFQSSPRVVQPSLPPPSPPRKKRIASRRL